MSKIRGRSWEDPMPKGRLPRGVTPCPRSGAVAKRNYPVPTLEARDSGREELPHAPTPEARAGGREDQPHVQGAAAAWVQEGLEELSYVESQEGWR